MKIFLPINIKPTGGSSTFAVKFQQGMAKKGHQVFFKSSTDYDILFVLASCPWRFLFQAKSQKKRIAHRLDGVYYPTTTAGYLYPLMNAPLKIIHRYFSDFTIYQSQYSKKCCDLFLGKTKNRQSTIIMNGVANKTFSPQGPKISIRENSKQKIFITHSRFRRPDQITPLLKSLSVFKKEYSDNFKFLIIGDSPAIDLEYLVKKYNLSKLTKTLGIITNNKIPSYLRSADVFLFSHLNPPCPNNVLEAMSCGLPICGVADGAMPEIVTPGLNGELINAPGEAFYRLRPFNTNQFAKNLNKILSNHEHYQTKASNIAQESFSLNNMITTYEKIISR